MDRKTGSDWVKHKGKYHIPGKYSFAVMMSQDLIYCDGHNNNVDILKRDDLTKVGSLATDNNPAFSFIVQGLKIYVGCAKNNLYVFEADTLNRIKDIKTAGIVYCFMQLDFNTVLCGETDGNFQILQHNNLGKV